MFLPSMTLDLSIINIHLLSLSSGGPHPLAEKPCFHVQPELVEWDGPTVSVAGDFLRVSNTDDASGENSDIWVWNWKTGKLHLVCVYSSK